MISTNKEFEYNNNNREKNDIYPTKPKTCFNTMNNNNSNYNTNREIINLLENKNKSQNIINDNISNPNDSMNKYINLIYEEKINKLKEEMKEMKKEKEKRKENMVLFITLIKKYSNKLFFLIEKIKNNNYNSEYNNIITTLYNLNDFIEKIESNNFSLEDNINQKKLFYQSINDSKEIEKNINEIISKYEKKINILNEHNKEMLIKIKSLKNENNELIKQAEEERNNKENILTKLNMLKDINKNLEKKYKILDSKYKTYFNQSTRNFYENKKFIDEIEHKNKIIKYLENLLQKKDFDQNDEIFKKMSERNINNINKIIDLKKNLKKVINVTKNINNENEKSLNDINSNSNKKNKNNKYFIENGNLYLNDKSIYTITNTSNNNKVKKEIDLIDKEIEQIQTKLETMLENK